MRIISTLCFLVLAFFGLNNTYSQSYKIDNNKVVLLNMKSADVQFLDFSYGNLEEIPENLKDFENLKRLNLSNNKLVSLKGLEELTSLEEINLSGNTQLLTTELAYLNGAAQALEKINFSDASLFYIPKELYVFQDLKMLNLSGNRITNIPLELKFLPKLESLDLSRNEIATFGAGIKFLTQLTFLDISDNYIKEGTGMYLQFSALKKLKQLRLDNVKCDEDLFAPKSLEEVHLKNCNNYLNESSYRFFKNIDVLKIGGSIGNEDLELLFKSFDKNKLQELTLTNNTITTLPASLSVFSSLEQLTVKSNSLRQLSEKMNRLEKLATIQLQDCINLDLDQLIKALIPVSNLNNLSLEGLTIVRLPTSIIRLNKLEKLSIVSSGFSYLPLDLQRLKRLSNFSITTSANEIANSKALKDKMINCDFVITYKNGEKRKEVLSPPLEEVNIAFEVYTINPSKSRTIVTASSSEIVIPEDAFLNREGEVVKGPVEISYREFKDPIDMAFAGVPMSTIKNGENLNFSSAGMMEFNAVQNNEQLLPNPNSLITVNYNSPFAGNDYNLYYLDPEEQDWVERGKDSLTITKKDTMKTRELNSVVEEEPELIKPDPILYPNYPFRQDYVELHSFYNKHNRLNSRVKVGVYNKNPRKIKRDTVNKVFSEFKYLNKFDWVIDKRYDTKKYKKKLDTLMNYIQRYNRVSYNRSNDQNSDYGIEAGLNLITDVQLVPNAENDNFDLVLSKSGELIKIPVIPTNLPKRAEVAQRRLDKFYSRYLKHLKLRQEDWALMEAKYTREIADYNDRVVEFEKAYKIYEKELSTYNNKLIGKLNLYSSTEENILRSFQLTNFGVFNCDVIYRIDKPKRLLAKLTSENGKRLRIKSLYILDKQMNGLLSFNGNAIPFFDEKHENSLIAILSNGKVGILKSRYFIPNELKNSSNSVALDLYDMKNTSIMELRKNAEIF